MKISFYVPFIRSESMAFVGSSKALNPPSLLPAGNKDEFVE